MAVLKDRIPDPNRVNYRKFTVKEPGNSGLSTGTEFTAQVEMNDNPIVEGNMVNRQNVMDTAKKAMESDIQTLQTAKQVLSIYTPTNSGNSSTRYFSITDNTLTLQEGLTIVIKPSSTLTVTDNFQVGAFGTTAPIVYNGTSNTNYIKSFTGGQHYTLRYATVGGVKRWVCLDLPETTNTTFTVTNGAQSATLQARKEGNRVTIHGGVFFDIGTGVAQNAVVGTIPAGWRPLYPVGLTVTRGNGSGGGAFMFIFHSDGNITMFSINSSEAVTGFLGSCTYFTD